MKTAIVGYTGFVGGNLCLSNTFDAYYNSKNITDAFGTQPDLLVYSGVKAEMFLANNFPDKDFEIIVDATENIKKINPKNVILISTIGVYPSMHEGNEDTIIDDSQLPAYGRNRLYLEKWVETNYPQSLIVRLPALYGKGIKKNFIYDMIHIVPALLKESKLHELLYGSEFINAYADQGNGFFKCIETNSERLKKMKQFFINKGFTALNFTDSRSQYQFFNLKYLWGLIEKSVNLGLRRLTITSEPLNVGELYEYIFNKSFVNEIRLDYPCQNLKSIHAELFGGNAGYIYSKEQILNDIKSFVKSNS